MREVAARFDDEDEYVAKALGEPAYAGRQTGTRVAGHPVVLSALFDDGGILRGIRMMSDPRGYSCRTPHGASARRGRYQPLWR